MRVVLDTNVVVSGLLWSNAPRQILDAVRANRLTAFTSLALIDELADVLSRDHLATLITRLETTLETTPAELVYGYSKLARTVTVTTVPRVVANDPDDDQVLACALAAGAELIITGDRKHLLPLKTYHGIAILTLSLIGVMEPGMIAVMEPVETGETGVPNGVQDRCFSWVLQVAFQAVFGGAGGSAPCTVFKRSQAVDDGPWWRRLQASVL